MRVLYRAEAVAEGGRSGHVRSSDGRLDLDLAVPDSMGGKGGEGTNPEELFAAGYAACFQSALLASATGRHLDLSGSRVTARVGIGPTGHGGFGLEVALDLSAHGQSREDASSLMERAHQLCPYSNAVRGNVEVTLTVDGEALVATSG
ncbi:MAG TPA: organic hydroperoxide resistance protein [Candidatus Dormibacteraeota bacterium]|nr:organic hydroperoxide resistance protein [Candidatus Dormibacteraeota bacterium]